MVQLSARPKKRSHLRRWLGQKVYTCRRFAVWYMKRTIFATTVEDRKSVV